MTLLIKISKKLVGSIIIIAVLIILSFFIGKWSAEKNKLETMNRKNNLRETTLLTNTQMIDWTKLIPEIAAGLLGPLMAGSIIWYLGIRDSDKKLKQDAIRDLMTFRGDYSSTDFTRSLNKVAIIFHDDEEIRFDIRKLYEVINNPTSPTGTTTRTIVGLIYKLCHKNGFPGLSEYDIDQSFVKASQNPEPSMTEPGIKTINNTITTETDVPSMSHTKKSHSETKKNNSRI